MFAGHIVSCFIIFAGLDCILQTVKGAKVYNAAIAAVSDGIPEPQQEEKLKVHTHSYCCLEYAQVRTLYSLI